MSWYIKGVLSLILVGTQAAFTVEDAQAASVLYLADGETDTLYTVNLQTGVATSVGAFGADAVNVGLTYDAINDQLLMSSRIATNRSGLYSVNQSTGAISLIGDTGIPAITGLGYDNVTQTLYAGSGFDDALYRLDTTSAAPTLIGSFGIALPANITGHGIGFDSNTSTAYLTDFATDNLYEIDTATGALSLIGSTTLTGAVGLAFDPETNVLYGVDATTDQLVTFDVGTGQATVVGALGFDAFNVGLAIKPTAVPEPTSSIALVIAFAGVMTRRKRKPTGI